MSADESNSHTETQTVMSHQSNPFHPATSCSAEYDNRVYCQSFRDLAPSQSSFQQFDREPYINAAPFQPCFAGQNGASLFMSEEHDWVSRGQQNLNMNAQQLQQQLWASSHSYHGQQP